ncbi:protein kinase [Myxococcus sp. K15C18031901]|uniref:serine/threonine-protein kinase n=1 Tax=Myxococcus dinghuensis TaxID=2906761 RepID=UPI0020A75794|nr:serine/threonine protein kinase [Myxococcus dinghuensis]MCP3101372.1 protein kinase [Myxococcus dinghuensis]
MTLEAGTQVGKYVVRRKLAEGGMAEIYLCTARGPEGFEKEVVIKRVRAFLASDPDFVGMFIAEARLASRLNHANVVQIFDFDKHEDTYYLAMEYVRGCSLWELRRRSKELMDPVPPMLVAHIGAEVARGLHYAHRLKVNGQPLDLVHRDVTPHNVLLSYDGAVKLTDFGIAKAGKKLTQPGVLKGKFAYMSPEQARGEAVDSRTDTFALGVVLWEMLTGGRLFDGDSELAVLRAVQHSVIPPPARLNPDVPPELDAAVMRALDRAPEARFQTAGELERALAQSVLKHARSVDDTDLGAYMRRVFPSSITQALPTVQERTHVVEGGPVPGADAVRSPVAREPTAVMSAGRVGAARALSPDEDFDASTFVLPRREEAPIEVSVPLPPMATPMLPLPAVASSPVPRPLPPVAAPIAAVRPSRPEGTPSVAPSAPEEVAVPTRTPSRSRGEAVASIPDGSANAARRPSRPDAMAVLPGAGAVSEDVDAATGLEGASGAAEEGAPGRARSMSRPEFPRVAEADSGAEGQGAPGRARSPSRPELPRVAEGASGAAGEGAPGRARSTSRPELPRVAEGASGAAGEGALGRARSTSRPELPRVVEGGIVASESSSREALEVHATEPLYRLPAASGEVPTITEPSPSGAPQPTPWWRRSAMGLAVGVGLVVVVGAVALSRFGGAAVDGAEPEATTSPANEAQVARGRARDEAGPPTPVLGAPSDGATKSTVTPPGAVLVPPGAVSSEVAAEVEGLKREAELAPEPRPVAEVAVRTSAQAEAPVTTGTLIIRATPYATVFLDGRRLGEVSGRATYKLSPGEHKLLFQHPSGEKRFDVTITAGGTVTREFRPARPR